MAIFWARDMSDMSRALFVVALSSDGVVAVYKVISCDYSKKDAKKLTWARDMSDMSQALFFVIVDSIHGCSVILNRY